jgi:oligopeptide/dipeptide ABC transporter ATP-binding protein
MFSGRQLEGIEIFVASVLMDIQDLQKKYVLGGGFLKGHSRIVRAVDELNLQIHQGETLGLVGESGCGKSTLAKILMMLEEPDAGNVFFQGKSIFSMSREDVQNYRRFVQMVFQDPYSSLNPRKTALSIVSEPLHIHRPGNKSENREAAMQLMARVGLNREQAKRYPHEFSGGQRQRIGIARALALQPLLMIADEPVSALDASIQAQILNLIQDLKQDFDLTYLFISHDLNVIRHVSNRVAVMYLGRIVELANKNDLYKTPLHPYTRMLLAAMPSCEIRGKKRGRTVLGEAGDAGDAGCSFKNRCIYKTAVCEEVMPSLKPFEGGGWCACHHTGKI